jgi:hypothetical protein
LAFAAALALNQAFRGRRFARTWIILSWIIPTIVIAILWRWMLNASYGIVNFFVTTLGIADGPIDFLGSPKWALPTVIMINAWRWFPFLALLILAGLQSIPGELYEAAKVDGANATQRFFRITMPQLQPVMYVVGLIGTLPDLRRDLAPDPGRTLEHHADPAGLDLRQSLQWVRHGRGQRYLRPAVRISPDLLGALYQVRSIRRVGHGGGLAWGTPYVEALGTSRWL